MTERRGVIIAVLLVVLLVAGIVDHNARSSHRAATVVATQPEARPASAGTSTWYCPVGAASPDNGPDTTVVVQNAGADAVTGSLTVFPRAAATGAPGASASQPVRIGAHSRKAVRESDVLRSSTVGAVVELDGGDTAVEATVGDSTAPCASATSDRWYVADGSTALNNTMLLELFNPFPDDAIVDMDFATDQGRTSPGAFQGVVVPARSVVSLNVGDHVRRRDHVSARISARRGRIVVGRVQQRTSPRLALLVSLAAPAPSTYWDFPDGIASENTLERFNLYNPSGNDATVQLALTLDQGAAEPLEIKVPAGDRVTFDPANEPRVPKGVGHAATLRSNVAIVAERTVDFIPASGHSGLGGGLGATEPAARWLLPQGAVTDGVDESVSVHNVGRRSVKVTLAVTINGRRQVLDGFSGVRLGAGERRVFVLRAAVTGAELSTTVDATGPVVVERLLARNGRAGINLSIGIPVGT